MSPIREWPVPKRDAYSIKGKLVDTSLIEDGYALIYDSASDTIIYGEAGGGGGPHTITSHTDVTDATGAQLEELTGAGETALHSHANDHAEDHAARHASGGGDAVNHATLTNGHNMTTDVATATNANVELQDLKTVSDSDTPLVNDVVKFDGSQWLFVQEGVDLELSITAFSDGISDTLQLIGGVDNWKEIGEVSFTATYFNGPPSSADVAMTGSATAWAGDLDMGVGTDFEGPTTNTEAIEYPSTRTGTIQFELTTSPTDTDTESVVFTNTMRYGNSANAQDAQTTLIVEGLTEVAGPTESRSQYIYNATAANYMCFAYGDALSNVAQVRVQVDGSGGYITASFDDGNRALVAPDVQSGIADVDNSAKFREDFAAITSTDTGWGAGTDWRLMTSSTAINHIEWGAHADNSGFNNTKIDALSTGGVSASNTATRTEDITNTTSSKYMVFAYPDARTSDPTQVRVGGLTAAFHSTVTSVTPEYETFTRQNRAGFEESYKVIASQVSGLAEDVDTEFQTLVSATPMNYIYWGECTVASTGDGDQVYTEANVEDNYEARVISNDCDSRDMVVSCSGSEYAYIAVPTRLGEVESIIIGGFESIDNFIDDHNTGASLTMTNPAGFREEYYVHVAENPGIDNTLVVTTSAG